MFLCCGKKDYYICHTIGDIGFQQCEPHIVSVHCKNLFKTVSNVRGDVTKINKTFYHGDEKCFGRYS